MFEKEGKTGHCMMEGRDGKHAPSTTLSYWTPFLCLVVCHSVASIYGVHFLLLFLSLSFCYGVVPCLFHVWLQSAFRVRLSFSLLLSIPEAHFRVGRTVVLVSLFLQFAGKRGEGGVGDGRFDGLLLYSHFRVCIFSE